jgi:hypothetical protein
MASMKFVHHDLGSRSRGEIVEITLSGNAANVRLMDSSNLQKFRRGQQHQYVGGLAKRSPVRLQIPRSGHWHITVDMIGLRGSVRLSARVLPGPLPTLREAPLSSMPSLLHDRADEAMSELPDRIDKEYDVFISHASEDKDEVVRPLAVALREAGLTVFYDDFELKIGDSLRRKIDHGLANSHFGVVVLSRDFFRKGWPQYELDGMVTKGIDGEQIILPIWHNITKNEVMKESPSLADKLARSTATHTIEEIAAEIADVVQAALFE